jgi:hypothetical protein
MSGLDKSTAPMPTAFTTGEDNPVNKIGLEPVKESYPYSAGIDPEKLLNEYRKLGRVLENINLIAGQVDPITRHSIQVVMGQVDDIGNLVNSGELVVEGVHNPDPDSGYLSFSINHEEDARGGYSKFFTGRVNSTFTVTAEGSDTVHIAGVGIDDSARNSSSTTINYNPDSSTFTVNTVFKLDPPEGSQGYSSTKDLKEWINKGIDPEYAEWIVNNLEDDLPIIIENNELVVNNPPDGPCLVRRKKGEPEYFRLYLRHEIKKPDTTTTGK